MLRFLIMVFWVACATIAAAEESTLMNVPPAVTSPAPPVPHFAPGMTVLFPDGRQTVIEEILPDGQWRTGLGVFTPPQGVVIIEPEQINPGATKPQVPVVPELAVPEKAQEPVKEAPVQIAVPLAPENPVKPEAPQVQPPASVKPNPDTPAMTLAELLPVTELPEKKAEKPQKPEIKPEGPKQEAPKAEKKEKPAPKPAPKPEKKAEKPKVGQELHIPEQAAKTGKLDFLEGCWQGTRPEYYSKRTVKECFCFGKGGKTGKRKVLDYTQGRTCIGGSHASLSSGGVLTVISSGAACNDGERWGQAEMVCRNSGPRTPCSWVFRDAQNGRQSYQIPFVRVESCGR